MNDPASLPLTSHTPDHPFTEPVTCRIVAFLAAIGLETRVALIEEDTFMPGIQVSNGVILIDPSRLSYPGDLLHEAGHLAVMSAEKRKAVCGDAGADAGEEMAAIAWSYAAALYLEIDPIVVFHPDGYRGASPSIRENFAAGCYFGVPFLQWLGLTADRKQAKLMNVPPYPHMLKWLRD